MLNLIIFLLEIFFIAGLRGMGIPINGYAAGASGAAALLMCSHIHLRHLLIRLCLNKDVPALPKKPFRNIFVKYRYRVRGAVNLKGFIALEICLTNDARSRIPVRARVFDQVLAEASAWPDPGRAPCCHASRGRKESLSL
jgi:hypothetical protein